MRIDWREAPFQLATEYEVAQKLYLAAKNKAASRRLSFDLGFDAVLDQVSHGICCKTGIPFEHVIRPYRGIDMPFRASLDRIDNTKGYSNENVQVVTKIYNTAKFHWNDDDVLRMAEGILTVNAYK